MATAFQANAFQNNAFQIDEADEIFTGGRTTWQSREYERLWDNIRIHQAAIELGRQGGLKGGQVRSQSMTPKQRSAAARNAAKARWK